MKPTHQRKFEEKSIQSDPGFQRGLVVEICKELQTCHGQATKNGSRYTFSLGRILKRFQARLSGKIVLCILLAFRCRNPAGIYQVTGLM
jgi:hypothetical protein